MGETPRTLVDRASRGDSHAVELLLERYLPELRGYLQKRAAGLVGKRESASDLAQSVCREVLQHVDRFEYDGEEGFRRWLYATAVRKIRDRHRYWRAAKRDAQRDVTFSAADDPRLAAFFGSLCTPSREVSLREELQRVERTFEELDPRYREVILLAHVERIPRAEIGERLGVTESHARVLLTRALAQLARRLRESGSRD